MVYVLIILPSKLVLLQKAMKFSVAAKTKMTKTKSENESVWLEQEVKQIALDQFFGYFVNKENRFQ